MATDTQGNVWAVYVHAANKSDTVEGCVLVDLIFGDLPSVTAVCADQGYRGTFVNFVTEKWGKEVHISGGRQGKGFEVEPMRWVAERTFAWFNGQRRLSKDFEKTTDSSESMIYIAAIARTLRSLVFNQTGSKRTSALTFEGYMPIESRLCFIFGAPAELATETGERGTPEHVLNSIHFAARAQLIGEFSNAGYNFLEFGLCAGEHGFPSKYGGISGGGVWHIPLTMNPDVGLESVDFESPELVGVAFYQRPADSGCVLIAQSYTAFPSLFAKYGSPLTKRSN